MENNEIMETTEKKGLKQFFSTTGGKFALGAAITALAVGACALIKSVLTTNGENEHDYADGICAGDSDDVVDAE